MQTKISHLDVAGRPVVVLEKTNVVPEHNQYFQVLLLPISISMNCIEVLKCELRPLLLHD
jgi:oligosaccharyltransferase complex subunit alpha (ribophorin I)